jgi:hypothetical protein
MGTNLVRIYSEVFLKQDLSTFKRGVVMPEIFEPVTERRDKVDVPARHLYRRQALEAPSLCGLAQR